MRPSLAVARKTAGSNEPLFDFFVIPVNGIPLNLRYAGIADFKQPRRPHCLGDQNTITKWGKHSMTEINGTTPDQTGANRGQFKPGQSGNPGGRPKGARSKLSESFLKALSEDFATNGIEVIEKVRNDRPHEYLKIAAAVLPKQSLPNITFSSSTRLSRS
jgi:hypothetical protein